LGLISRLNQPNTAWMYCGGVENRSSFISETETATKTKKGMALLGCDATSVRAVRDPVQLAECLRSAGLPFARVITPGHVDSNTEGPIKTSRWIAKDSEATSTAQIAASLKEAKEATFAQQFIEGESQSVSFVSNGKAAVCLGTTRGFTLKEVIPSHPSATDHPFGYAGSTGPLPVSAAALQTWQQLGDVLVREFGLKGLFGVDAMVTPDGRIIPVEVNPRYTASMELVERATQRSMIQMHIDACLFGTLPDIAIKSSEIWSKQIIYAREPMTFSATRFGMYLDAWQDHVYGTRKEVDFADLPYFDSTDGSRSFERGQPIMTVLSRGDGFIAERV